MPQQFHSPKWTGSTQPRPMASPPTQAPYPRFQITIHMQRNCCQMSCQCLHCRQHLLGKAQLNWVAHAMYKWQETTAVPRMSLEQCVAWAVHSQMHSTGKQRGATTNCMHTSFCRLMVLHVPMSQPGNAPTDQKLHKCGGTSALPLVVNTKSVAAIDGRFGIIKTYWFMDRFREVLLLLITRSFSWTPESFLARFT